MSAGKAREQLVKQRPGLHLLSPNQCKGVGLAHQVIFCCCESPLWPVVAMGNR